ncbi:nucleotidyltransferase-like protein [Bacillus alkalicellulosilyticus]|uniref:nucleotidyltransferase-like protein n=1 Tax=Alkalihalobacterium alkalicellulosilyticum TaxID=1912214 RepID=UPI000995EA42|nr:nucleotidyltransferase-like protein [Bacillus alkalicellulosilyticus]
MEVLFKGTYERYIDEEDTLGILFIEKKPQQDSIFEYKEVSFLVIKNTTYPLWHVSHFECLGNKAEVHLVDEQTLNRWSSNGTKSRFVEWLFCGKLIYETSEYVTNMRERLHEFPMEERQKKMVVELSKLIRRFEDGKELYHTENYFDSFNHILQALHHQARLALIEHGFYPEVTLWNQVKNIEPETYKLYQELLVGDEVIDKRLELLLIANEFAITSKLKKASAYLLSVMDEKEEPWEISQLMTHPDLREYEIDLEIVMEYLAQRQVVVVTKRETATQGTFEYLYRVKY